MIGFSCVAEKNPPQIVVSVIENPALEGARYPFLAGSDELNPLMSWFAPLGDGYQIQFSSYRDHSWSDAEPIAGSSQFFVNWADFPSIISYKNQPVAAHWLKKVAGGAYAYHVEISFRNNDGSWTNPVVPHTDGTATEHGFVSMIALDEDRVIAVWLDGRNMAGVLHGQILPATEGAGPRAAMTLRSAIVHRDGRVTNEHEIDSAVCECCQTSMARSGDQVIVLYRNRTESEIRDIYYSVYDLESDSWNTPAAIADDGWEIGGCPVNGPRITAHNGQVTAVWFTGAGDQSRSYMAVSDDGGRVFGAPVQIDNGSSLGRVGVLTTTEGVTWMSWISAGEDPAKIYVRTRSPDGRLSDPAAVAEIDPSRGSGFPQMAETGDGVLMSWTSPRPTSKINTILIRQE